MSDKQAPQAFGLVMNYLDNHTYGVTYRGLLDAMQEKATPEEVSRALDYAVNSGEARFTYQPGPEDPQWKRAVDVVFYPALSMLLPVATQDEVDAVVEYFSRHEDYGRMGGGATVMLEVAQVYRDLSSKMSVQKISHALVTLRQEELLHFMSREKNGYLTVTLPGTRSFTVVALEQTDPPYYGAPYLYKVRCFHVRAGTPEKACEKVENLHLTEAKLIPQLVSEGYLKSQAAPGQPVLEVTRL